MEKIQGFVTRVIDGDTFDIDVTWKSPLNHYSYNPKETVRINKIDAPELNEPGGKRSKEKLSQKILGKTVDLTVHSRDDYRRIICDVTVVKVTVK